MADVMCMTVAMIEREVAVEVVAITMLFVAFAVSYIHDLGYL
jgi:hypothetical protein